ncbi:hypothetical protein [Streptosporangium roseum]|uniref:hypothetical protein n=1 Tax=Streptosporangium roseum TaxID=2001 RepID=UPI0004CCD54D|nr:hypothetical protein [Streptosporangium roseum]
MTEVERDIISITPAPGWLWTAHFKTDDEEWQLPVAGWALVRHDYGDEGTENHIEPVVMEESKYPTTIYRYCKDREDDRFVYQGLRAREVGSAVHFNEGLGASLLLAPEGSGSRDALIEYVQSVIEQRTTTNDDTSAERLARGIVTSILSRLGAGFSTAVGGQEGSAS